MHETSDGCAVCSGKSSAGVEMSFSLQELLEALPDSKEGAHATTWTKEEDAALLAAWPKKRHEDVARILGKCQNVCRRRYRELTNDRP